MKTMRVAMAVLAILALGVSAQADLYAHDPFSVGTGAYTTGDLTPQTPDVPGFTGTWKDGTTATAAFAIYTDGIDHPDQELEVGGRVGYSGYGDGIRRVYRTFATYPTKNIYYVSSIIRLDTDGDTSGLNVMGFYQNTSLNDTQFFDSNAARDQEGLGWGFYGHDDQIDLVLRHRFDPNPAAGNQGQQMLLSTLVGDVEAGDAFFVVAKIEKDVIGSVTTGNDRVSVWINPADATSEAAAGAATYTFEDYALSQTNRIQRLVFASSYFGNQVSYDEPRFGTAWEDVAPIPEPATLTLLALGALPLLRRRRA